MHLGLAFLSEETDSSIGLPPNLELVFSKSDQVEVKPYNVASMLKSPVEENQPRDFMVPRSPLPQATSVTFELIHASAEKFLAKD